MMMVYITRKQPEGAKAEKPRIKIEKLREAKAEARKRVLVALMPGAEYGVF